MLPSGITSNNGYNSLVINLTKDSIFLTGNLNSIDFSAINLTAPQIYVENAELHVIKEIDGGTF